MMGDGRRWRNRTSVQSEGKADAGRVLGFGPVRARIAQHEAERERAEARLHEARAQLHE
jgi:hypothetical protein